jgi:hypothetical protein
MPPDRRIPDSAESYPDDRSLLQVVLEEPEGLFIWPASGLAEAGLTGGQQAVVATWRLDAEVRNGGFGGYFAALGGEARRASGEALAGLARLGAEEHRRLLATALDLFDRGLPEGPDARLRRLEALLEAPRSEEEYQAALTEVVGATGPDLEVMRRRGAERRAHRAELGRIFGDLDDRYLGLAREGRGLDRYWVAYVRTNPGEFFSG